MNRVRRLVLERHRTYRATRVLTLFFLVAILLGTLVLSLPAASADGRSCGLFPALFTAAAAVSVTGLSLGDTAAQWSLFGQAALFLLLQIGALGYMTFISVFYFLFRRRIGLRERLILQQSMALNELDGVVRLVKLVLAGTLIMEALGAAVLTVRFLRLMPPGQALWFGVFHAVSAFCNAGYELMGALEPGAGMTLFAGDVTVNVTLMVLTVVGGLGFFVWNDLLMHRFRWRYLAVHTRLVLVTSGILTVGGTVLILIVEWRNPGTLGSMSGGEKLLAALFQSVNTRSTGFYTVRQEALTGSGKLISILLMLVGGSSGSTAGGLKTVTVALLFLTAWQVLRNRRDIVVFGRKIPQDQVNSAAAICFLVVALALGGGVAIATWDGLPLSDCVYESVAAICTVGLSTGVTAGLCPASKILLMIYMFFGRVGIMTISFAWMSKTPPDNTIGRPETRVLLG